MEPSEPKAQAFTEWLRAMAASAGAASAADLRRLLAQQDCSCTVASLEEWMAGTGLPAPDKMREVITAMNHVLPGIDTWEEYRRYVKGERGEEVRARRDSAEIPDNVEELIEGSGRLPPFLTD